MNIEQIKIFLSKQPWGCPGDTTQVILGESSKRDLVTGVLGGSISTNYRLKLDPLIRALREQIPHSEEPMVWVWDKHMSNGFVRQAEHNQYLTYIDGRGLHAYLVPESALRE